MAPAISDISSDVDDAPLFPRVPGGIAKLFFVGKSEVGPMPARHAAIIRTCYPKVQTLVLHNTTPAAAFEAALAAARAMVRWRVDYVDAEGLLIQGVGKTRVLRICDDFVIRVQAAPGGDGACTVDMRSRSRVGNGDTGVNAARIELYLGRLAVQQGATSGSEAAPVVPAVNAVEA